MIYRIFSTKDTFISSFRRLGVPQTSSNFGSSEILHLYKVAPVTSSLSASIARMLLKFSPDDFSVVTGSEGVASGSVSFYLRMFDAQHDGELPSSFSVQIQAVSQDWDEGRGHDVDYFSDKGFANWDKAKSDTFWSVPGASGSGPIVTCSFDTGHENIDVDVSPIVRAWLTGGLSNYGFLVKLSGAFETDNQDYYIKMFHGRETWFKDKRPFLEARWDESVRTGSIGLTSTDDPYVVNVSNLKNRYSGDEVPKLKLFVRERDWNPAVVLTSSNDPIGLAPSQGYYQIVNDRTDLVVVPFGTGTVETTRISYNSSGSYFKLYMSSLSPNEIYRISFLFIVSGSRHFIDEGFKFKVV